jgi:hypothetical protein
MAIRKPKPERELTPDELRAQRLAAIARMRALHEKVMARLGGIRPDGDAISRDIAEARDDREAFLDGAKLSSRGQMAHRAVVPSEDTAQRRTEYNRGD